MGSYRIFHRINKPRSMATSQAQTVDQPIPEREHPIHPGLKLRDLLEAISMPQVRLAELLNMNRSQLNEILSGRRPVNMSTSMLLEAIFDIPADVWINMQNDYDAYAFLHDSKSQTEYERAHRYARQEMGKYVDAVHRFGSTLVSKQPSDCNNDSSEM